ncbi:MAG: hypothetical protein ACI81T_002026 [Bacteroidia bacterium]
MATYKNITGTLILYKYEEKYKWNHRYNRFFLQDSKKIEKVKMKGDDAKYLAWSWAYDEDKQEMIVIASKVPRLTKGKADPSKMDLGYKSLVFDKDLNLVKETDLDLPSGAKLKMNALIPKKGTKWFSDKFCGGKKQLRLVV